MCIRTHSDPRLLERQKPGSGILSFHLNGPYFAKPGLA